MEILYCWRCKMDIPMLDESEWAQVSSELRRRDVKKRAAFQLALDAYERLTGFKETNVNALHHHRISLYGPACSSCGKPMRTPDATLCGACMRPRAG